MVQDVDHVIVIPNVLPLMSSHLYMSTIKKKEKIRKTLSFVVQKLP